MNTPLLFLIFNRPETTFRVFDAIRKAQPEKLFIAADGPRADRPDDKDKCLQTRKIVNSIDWPCEVKILFRDKNLGCKIAVSSAIDWFFNHVNEGVIIEDDCLPINDFFVFCEKMLEKYRTDENIMAIAGHNIAGEWASEYSYIFSKYGSVWGWATWKRAWNKYDVEMKSWSERANQDKILNFAWTKRQAKVKIWSYNQVFNGNKNSWAYIWEYTRMINEGLTILPKVNLIENIGFGVNATHTKDIDGSKKVAAKHLSFPLLCPENIAPDRMYDQYLFERLWLSHESLPVRLYKKIKNICGIKPTKNTP